MFYFLYIYKYRVHALDGFKKCNRIYPVSSSCRLTLRFLPTPVQLRAQHLSLSRWAVLILLITIIEGLPLSHPLCSALWDGVLPSWWGIKPSEWTQWGEQWANGRAGKEKVTGFSIGSITANFHWDKESCSSRKIHCIWTSSLEGGFLSVVWQERHGLEKISDEAIESSELFLQSANFSITIVGR